MRDDLQLLAIEAKLDQVLAHLADKGPRDAWGIWEQIRASHLLPEQRDAEANELLLAIMLHRLLR